MSDTPNTPPNGTPKPSDNGGQHLDLETWKALQAAGFTEGELYDDQPLGPVIYRYTRADAIADGVLVGLSAGPFARLVAKAGVKVHTAMTATCFAEVVSPDLLADHRAGRTYEVVCRVAAVLVAFAEAARKAKAGEDRVFFAVEGVSGGQVRMYGHIGPGDAGEPVVTLMLEGED